MQRSTYRRRSLAYHWRSHLAVSLGVVVGTAALSGALLVGDSMRGSLREIALGRLGDVDYSLVSTRFFRENLAAELAASNGVAEQVDRACPVILLHGGATHTETSARVNRVSILGVDERFWRLRGEGASWAIPELTGRVVVLNEPLARDLGAVVGDAVLIRVGKPQTISTETLLGRRNDPSKTLRLTVGAVIPADDLGVFSLSPRQVQPRNAFVPLVILQRALDRPALVNTILLSTRHGDSTTEDIGERLRLALAGAITLEDFGLRLRLDDAMEYASLESDSLLIEPLVESAAMASAKTAGLSASSVQAYLANRITKIVGGDAVDDSEGGSGDESTAGVAGGGIPFSTVAAISPGEQKRAMSSSGERAPLQHGEIALNEWAASDLEAKPGDRVALDYYVTGSFGKLETRRAMFTLREIVAMTGPSADPGFVPEYKGVTDTQNLADWDPPFPMDLSLIRDKDEAYWDEYRTTPKAFISSADGERLWAEDAERFGRYTSIRLRVPSGNADLGGLLSVFERELLKTLDPGHMDLAFDPVRTQMADAGRGTTDFGGLFIGFSFFLIASAAMLVALLFRLGVERRAREVGVLLAIGFSPAAVTRTLIMEGVVPVVTGAVIGSAAALGYAWFMLAGLRSWWSGAVNTPFLRLHVTPESLLIGLVAGILIAIGTIAWSIRGLSRLPASSLLAGSVASGRGNIAGRGGRTSAYIAAVALLVAVATPLLPSASDTFPQAIAFFLSGAAALTACLAFLAYRLGREHQSTITRGGNAAVARLGIRNARRRRGRSILTAGLIASASFLIAALEAFHMDVDTSDHDRNSGTGGFALFAESPVPLIYDLNTSDGREALNIDPAAGAALSGVTVTPFRLRPGDESSCLNLYRPTKPRILGATDEMIERGGFRFSATMADSEEDRLNPWRLLHREFDDGAIGVIGDEAAVKWQLHLGLGKDLIIADERGREVRLRFVALLSGSALQDELIISETGFEALFPSIGGHGFFLIDASEATASAVEIETILERELATFSFDAGSTSARLAEYLTVQNTYLSTFRTLGGFGLILGTVGLAVVLLRNVWERRSELALMRALGFSRAKLGWMVLAENAALLVAGLLAGSVSAMLAVAPHVLERAGSLPWVSLGATLAAVFAVGMLTGVAALLPTLRSPLLPALRGE